MLVAEGRASRRRRIWFAAVAVVILVCMLVLCEWFPRLRRVLVVVQLVLGGLILARYVPLSLLARRPAEPVPGNGERRASLAFIVPCLNELTSLKRSIPAMMALHYGGGLRFYYVCEAASRDGSLDYVRECAQADPRVVAIEKDTEPQGRGAAVRYGLARIGKHNVVGFIDADHVIDQASLDRLVGVFSTRLAPPVVQGVCASANESRSPIARLLSIERSWLEAVELKANPAIGGVPYYGGGQGFLRGDVASDERFQIDDSMILDDIDLSIRLALNGGLVRYCPQITTRSLQPQSLAQFFDQRYRWCRGWLQVSQKHFFAPLKRSRASFTLRMDILRMLIFPYMAGLLYLTSAAALSALAAGPDRWLGALALLCPAGLGFLPYVAKARSLRLRELPLSVLGILLLVFTYYSFFAVSLVEAFVFRRQPLYPRAARRELLVCGRCSMKDET